MVEGLPLPCGVVGAERFELSTSRSRTVYGGKGVLTAWSVVLGRCEVNVLGDHAVN